MEYLKTLLIANRGEIAVRIIKTARQGHSSIATYTICSGCSSWLTFPDQTPGNQNRSHIYRARFSLTTRRRSRHLPAPRRRRHKGLSRQRPNHPKGQGCRRTGNHPRIRLPLRRCRLRPLRRRSRPALRRPKPREHQAVRAQAHGAGAGPGGRRARRPGNAGAAGRCRRRRQGGGWARVPRDAQVYGWWWRHGAADVWG